MSKDDFERILEQLEAGENPTSQTSSNNDGTQTSERGYSHKSAENQKRFPIVNEGTDTKCIKQKNK